MNMWTRSELKERGKAALHRNYGFGCSPAHGHRRFPLPHPLASAFFQFVVLFWSYDRGTIEWIVAHSCCFPQFIRFYNTESVEREQCQLGFTQNIAHIHHANLGITAV